MPEPTLAEIAAWHRHRASSLREAAESMRRGRHVNESVMVDSPCAWHEAAARQLEALAAPPAEEPRA
jgi:hypothetical protein